MFCIKSVWHCSQILSRHVRVSAQRVGDSKDTKISSKLVYITSSDIECYNGGRASAGRAQHGGLVGGSWEWDRARAKCCALLAPRTERSHRSPLSALSPQHQKGGTNKITKRFRAANHKIRYDVSFRPYDSQAITTPEWPLTLKILHWRRRVLTASRYSFNRLLGLCRLHFS